jgi:hypothetical protein
MSYQIPVALMGLLSVGLRGRVCSENQKATQYLSTTYPRRFYRLENLAHPS